MPIQIRFLLHRLCALCRPSFDSHHNLLPLLPRRPTPKALLHLGLRNALHRRAAKEHRGAMGGSSFHNCCMHHPFTSPLHPLPHSPNLTNHSAYWRLSSLCSRLSTPFISDPRGLITNCCLLRALLVRSFLVLHGGCSIICRP
jgi:hypothetical protein